MVSVRISVKPEILRWARSHSGTALPNEWQERINDWIDQKKEPTIKQLQALSQKTQIPFGYFFLEDMPDEEIPLLKFRTIDNNEIDHPSRNLIDTINEMETKRAWLSDYRKSQGFGKNSFVNAQDGMKNSHSLADVAQAILAELDLEMGWNYQKHSSDRFNTLRVHLDNVGVTVMTSGFVKNSTRRTLDQNEFRAFALIDEYAPLIFVNSNDSFRAMLFSLVHEMVHVWYGTPELFNATFQASDRFRDDVTEQKINRVTEEILFPKTIFLQAWEKINLQDQIQKVLEIAKEFGTSPLSAGIRAVRLTLIPQDIVDDLKDYLQHQYEQKKMREKQRDGGPNYYVVKASQIDKTFARTVDQSARSGEITYTEAFDLLNVKNNSGFDKLMAEVNGGER